MSKVKENMKIRPARVQDLELLISWRSNPKIYNQFRGQDSALDWQDHVSWFSSRSNDRHDYIIEYNGRRVGSIYLDEDRYVGVYIGEISLQGEGIGTQAINWAVETFGKPLHAEIHEDNVPSQAAFEKCGFVKKKKEDQWIEYKLDDK